MELFFPIIFLSILITQNIFKNFIRIKLESCSIFFDFLLKLNLNDNLIKYRFSGTRYGYGGSSSGYLSEPEPRGYSDRSSTYDNRRRVRNKENEFTTSTMPKKLVKKIILRVEIIFIWKKEAICKIYKYIQILKFEHAEKCFFKSTKRLFDICKCEKIPWKHLTEISAADSARFLTGTSVELSWNFFKFMYFPKKLQLKFS